MSDPLGVEWTEFECEDCHTVYTSPRAAEWCCRD